VNFRTVAVVLCVPFEMKGDSKTVSFPMYTEKDQR
jgi:hypothetical protein